MREIDFNGLQRQTFTVVWITNAQTFLQPFKFNEALHKRRDKTSLFQRTHKHLFWRIQLTKVTFFKDVNVNLNLLFRFLIFCFIIGWQFTCCNCYSFDNSKSHCCLECKKEIFWKSNLDRGRISLTRGFSDIRPYDWSWIVIIGHIVHTIPLSSCIDHGTRQLWLFWVHLFWCNKPSLQYHYVVGFPKRPQSQVGPNELGTLPTKKNGIFWEFFPKGGGGLFNSQNFWYIYQVKNGP